MANQTLTQPTRNRNTPTLTPDLIAQISERSGIEPQFVTLWGGQLETGNVTDQDGARLIQIWLDVLSRESGVTK